MTQNASLTPKMRHMSDMVKRTKLSSSSGQFTLLEMNKAPVNSFNWVRNIDNYEISIIFSNSLETKSIFVFPFTQYILLVVTVLLIF